MSENETFIQSSGGGSSNFAPGADPARQDLEAGTAPATTTFNAFTGGTGPLTYATVLSRPAGSIAAVAGAGLGAYTWSDTAANEAYALSLTATDANGNEATAVAVVERGAPNPWSQVVPNARFVNRVARVEYISDVFAVVT